MQRRCGRVAWPCNWRRLERARAVKLPLAKGKLWMLGRASQRVAGEQRCPKRQLPSRVRKIHYQSLIDSRRESLSGDEIKKALRVEAALSEMLDEMQCPASCLTAHHDGGLDA